jgi:Na+/H+-translocating membrane pyrophosphatase
MITTILAAAGTAAADANPYGLQAALREGGLISQTVFGILVLMSVVSFYILFSKLFEQQKIMAVELAARGLGQAREELGLQADRRRRSGRSGAAFEADRPGRGA